MTKKRTFRLPGGSSATTGRAGRHHLADAEIDLLHRPGDRAEHLAPRQPGLRRIEPRLRGAQRRLGLVERLLRAGPVLSKAVARSKACCAFFTAASCIATSARCRSSSSVNSGARGSTCRPRAPTASRSGRPRRGRRRSGRPRPSPGRSASGSPLQAGRSHGRRDHCRNEKGLAHGSPFLPNRRSRWARISSRTSSGAKRSNSAFQISASSAGATSNCGKRASASLGNSPRSTARGQQRAHRRQNARDHLAVVELGELRKPRPFGQDQPDHVARGGCRRPRARTRRRSSRRRRAPADRPAAPPRWRRPPGSASCGRAPGTASPCRGSRDRSCPWRRPPAGRRRRAAPRQSPWRKTRRARPAGWRRGVPRGDPRRGLFARWFRRSGHALTPGFAGTDGFDLLMIGSHND